MDLAGVPVADAVGRLRVTLAERQEDWANVKDFVEFGIGVDL